MDPTTPDASSEAAPDAAIVGSELVGRRLAGSAARLAGRQAMITLLSGVGTVAITRLLGPSAYGAYASVIATWALLSAAADFGFSLMLSRDLATHPHLHRPMLRSAYEVGTAWSLLLAFVMLALGVVAGLDTSRGKALVLLSLPTAASGLVAARTYFIVTYRTAELVRVDVVITALQVVGMVAVAAAGLGPVGVTAVVAVGGTANLVVPALLARRHLGPAGEETFGRGALIRSAAPLGLLGLMTRVYMVIDLVLLGWMVSGPRLGDYAAATKIMSILMTVVGVVMNVALPALSSAAHDRDELRALMAKVWHWLMVAALPMFVATALFAPTIVLIAVGRKYEGAANLLRILSIAGLLSVANNFLGVVLIAMRRTRTLFVQNAVAIGLNVGGNLLLVPVIGVAAAAWMTAATEALVCAGALVVLARQISLRECVHVSRRPVMATALGALVGLLLIRWPVLAIPASGAAFLVATAMLDTWPHDLRVNVPSWPLLRRFG
jgi:O-antigen/teichoic acid export membrane protein